MSLMGSRSACRLASHYARWMGIQRAAGGDGWRLMMSRWLASASSSSNATATMPKVPKPQQPTVVVSQVSQTHTSAVLVPPQQTDGAKVAVKLEEEYPCDVAPVEIPTKNDLQQPLSESDQSDEAHFASRIEAFRMVENKSASAASSNLGRGERQAHTTTAARKNSVDKKETAKFAAIAATWWDPKGPYKPLHIMNPTRVSYVRSSICKHFRKDANTARPLEGLKIIDVGCGGGLVCEPLARMGAEVTGVDAVEKNIGVASIHAARDPTTASIKYMCTTAASAGGAKI